MESIQIVLLVIFVAAAIIGYVLINKVPSLLHTPLMSGMNALSGVTVLGALAAFSAKLSAPAAAFGIFAVALAAVNVVGGFFVTDRMLKMISKEREAGTKTAFTVSAVAGAVLLAGIVGMAFVPDGAAVWMYYAFCAVLTGGVLIGIALMSNVKTAVLGNAISALSMALAIVLTFVYGNVFSSWQAYAGLALGAAAGLVIARKVKMIQMPQTVALLNGLGGAASSIVAVFAVFGIGCALGAFSNATSGLALLVGVFTLTGSLIAAGKLAKILNQKSVVFKGQSLVAALGLILSAVCVILLAVLPVSRTAQIGFAAAITVFAAAFGYAFSVRVGGADMPITISLLNSLSGVACAIAGLAISDLLLVAVGGIVGASGLLLTQIMCRSMNRRLFDILLGKTTKKSDASDTAANAAERSEAQKENADKEQKSEIEPEDKTAEKEENPAEILRNAKTVIIVPGYGMAIAQAQHLVKALADKLTANGTAVKYAVHPVAGRMPGHMNVLLCEANVDYEDLYEMDAVNPEFATADATVVVGANDVLNPSAREAEGTPIYGMPILNVDCCKHIFIFNYDLKPGYAGVENPIYSRTNGVYMYLGNAAETLKAFLETL